MSLNQGVTDFIFKNIGDHPRDMARLIIGQYGVSRQTANSYLRELVDKGLIAATGKTKARNYTLRDFVSKRFTLKVTRDLKEDAVWVDTVREYINGSPENVVRICRYGFTEMVNNVVDHSESSDLLIQLRINVNKIEIVVMDLGVGIFNKIQEELKLDNKWYSILELAKGKVTTDKAKHTGEGIFFTARMFDEFTIFSDNLFFRTTVENEDWIFEIESQENTFQGTHIVMRLSPRTTRTSEEVFHKYEIEDKGFSRTHVPVRLARYEGEELVSRSQAKRIVVRFEKFTEVILDFMGVSTIGQAFADELFRVFPNEHPEIHIVTINATEEVQRMIDHVLNTDKQEQLNLLDRV